MKTRFLVSVAGWTAVLPILALAQQAYPMKPMPLPGQLTIALPTSYTARPRNLAIAGQFDAAGVTWNCAKGVCRVNATWPSASVKQCAALAARVGAISAFGSARGGLSPAELETCNASAVGPMSSVSIAPPSATVPRINQPAPNTGSPMLSPAVVQQLGLRVRAFDDLLSVRERAEAAARASAGAATPDRTGMVKHAQGGDCDDLRRDIHPLAAEVCDNRDNNCDGYVDEGQKLVFFLDADGDLHGDPARRVEACPADQRSASDSGEWLVLVGNDCDDADPAVWRDCP